MNTIKYPELLRTDPQNDSTKGISRRVALKAIGISPIAAALLTTPTLTTAVQASEAKGKIVIVGGGAGGIMALARIHRALVEPDITIITPNETHLYQRGQIFMATGEYAYEDIIKGNDHYIPEDVSWIKDEVARFQPDKDRVITRKGKKIKYDHLIIATGIVPYYDAIEGLSEEDIGTKGIASIYLNDLEAGTARGAEITGQWFKDIALSARHTRPTVLHTLPDTPIKCEAVPQQILYLSADHLRDEDPDLGCEHIFTTARSTLFELESVADSLEKVQGRYDTITNKFRHVLVAIDIDKKIATYKIKDTIDEQKNALDSEPEKIEIKYDLIHIVPPMGPPKAISDSELVSQKGAAKGWLEVDSKSLQHKRYKNIFGIGDVCGIALGKTGSSARHQAPVLEKNLVAQMEERALLATYDGYTSCPINTHQEKVLFTEYNENGLITSLPLLDPSRPRWIWWAVDIYIHRPMYWQLMMRGLI